MINYEEIERFYRVADKLDRMAEREKVDNSYFRMAYCVETEKVQRAMKALRKFVETEYQK